MKANQTVVLPDSAPPEIEAHRAGEPAYEKAPNVPRSFSLLKGGEM